MSYTNINNPSLYFNTKLYTGNGSTQSIDGINFQPDMVILKSRSNATNHQVYDVIRGATKKIITNGTNAEGTEVNGLQSFDSDGFTLGLEYDVNNSSATYASWNWLANGAGSSNTDGSISATVSASTTSGFSIVTYTGTGSSATVGHGLGSAPNFIAIKKLSSTGNWGVYHSSLGATKYLLLNTTDAEGTSSAPWNNTAPTSSVFTVNTSADVNGSGATYVAYCFAEKKGFSKFGSYTGNGSTDGTFVYTGFRPAWVLIKCTSTAGDQWQLSDNDRGYNGAIKTLYPDSSEAETSTDAMDILSNGFKLRNSSTARNGSGATYIYMAFAEFPIVSSSGVPCTAR